VSDEQTPGNQPQDPPQPGAQPPPADAPPPSPVNPYDQQPTTPDPAAPPAYGQPQQPTYGEPQQPVYGQPAMAAGYPAAPFEPPKGSRATAIVALVLALVICIPFLPALVAIVLAIVVLVANKPGKGLAIAAIVISLLASAAWIGLFAAIGSGDFDDVFDDLLPVEQLAAGECLNASNLTDDSEDFVEDIEEVTCDGPHDAEVLVTKELTQEDADGYAPESSSLCTDLITEAGLADKLASGDLGYFGLTTDSAPNAGDKLVCIAYRLDGTKLEAPL